jgi:hypothetical protein
MGASWEGFFWEAHGTIRGTDLILLPLPRSKGCLKWSKLFFGHTMALELSKQAYVLCREQDASGLRAFLEEHSADIDLYRMRGRRETSEDGTFNIMGLAAHHESPECMQELLDFGANVNNKDRTRGTTPLMFAAYFDRVGCMRLLLEKNADVAVTRDDGSTALILASCICHSECLRLLIENNADVDFKDERGPSGLTMAALKGHLECVKLLIEAEADVNQPDVNGCTGIHHATAWMPAYDACCCPTAPATPTTGCSRARIDFLFDYHHGGGLHQTSRSMCTHTHRQARSLEMARAGGLHPSSLW